ncbi:uncharacterized protein LOC130628891 isoform X2 [Hydractinia symbiolongicarpus]|uniref:uncharacterized protein LOC130628891 isoform X2 n=1 Tax=Hydractinia symbiolongicarpus TaxID=13093 RepID=UPI0025503D09|nr:uncharacterized protein LOC130628891 isoform X2 [Hydractinia symbiolongicarpus]
MKSNLIKIKNGDLTKKPELVMSQTRFTVLLTVLSIFMVFMLHHITINEEKQLVMIAKLSLDITKKIKNEEPSLKEAIKEELLAAVRRNLTSIKANLLDNVKEVLRHNVEHSLRKDFQKSLLEKVKPRIIDELKVIHKNDIIMLLREKLKKVD